MPHDWNELTQIFHRALERPDAEREAFVRDACGGNETRCREILSLLAHREASGPLDTERLGASTVTADRPHDSLIGREVAGYRITSLLGMGGMGVVYKAVDSKFDRPVAVKLLSEPLATSSARRRFLREAQTASALNHPHILTIHDIGDLDSRHFIVTEFVDGGTLRDWATEQPRSWQAAVDLIVGVADALATAHEAGIIHRDIKPENILVSRAGYAKLADFGLAKVAPAADITAVPSSAIATQAGMVMGTPGYMSPEQAAGAIVDARSDVFSFGVVLHELLAGQRPFAAPTTAAEMQRIVHSEPDPLNDSVPTSLRLVVARALQKNPDLRYQTMREVVVDLRRVARGTADEVRPVVPAPRWLLPIGAVVLLALAAVGSYALWRPAVAAAGQIRSIAVLPFENLSSDPGQEYFSDGMTDALITRLAQIHALDVTARASVMRFKHPTQSIPQIGRTLGVDAIVESSVQRSNNRVRITAQLIRAATGTLLWAQEFNGSTSDLLDLQSDIARAISEQIRVRVTPDESDRLATVRTVRPEAQDAFLLGRYQFWKGNPEGYKAAIASFHEAIRLQPDYAAAYAALSTALVNARAFGIAIDPDEIRLTAEKALELDSNLAEAHVAVGVTLQDKLEWAAAEAAFRRAMELNPDSQDTCHCYASLLSILGRFSESIPLMQHSTQINPLVAESFTDLGMRLYEARSYREAEAALHHALDMEPQNLRAQIFLASVDIATHKAADAVPIFARDTFQGRAHIAWAYAAAGERREALEVVRRVSAKPVLGDFPYLALAFAHLGDMDQAFVWLTKAFDTHFAYVPWANVSPMYDVFRGDPRFDALVARLHLPSKP